MMLAGTNEQQQGSPCACPPAQEAPAKPSSPFLQQVLLSVTVAVVTAFLLERVLGRSR
jgi:hypothetical protein